MKLFEKMSIIGVGLLGASLAKACRKYNLVEGISGFGRNRENLEKAKDALSISLDRQQWYSIYQASTGSRIP